MGRGLGDRDVVADDATPAPGGQRIFALQPAPGLRDGSDEREDHQMGGSYARAPVVRTGQSRPVATTRAMGGVVCP